MTTFDPALYQKASTAVQICAGAALLPLGVAEALHYAGSYPRARVYAAVFFSAGAAFMAAALPLVFGGLQGAAVALSLKGGFYIFPAIVWTFTGTAIALLMSELRGRVSGFWGAVFAAGLLAAGGLLMLVPSYADTGGREAIRLHYFSSGLTLIAAASARLALLFFPRRELAAACGALLIAAGAQLAAYREAPASFNFGGVTLTIKSQIDN